MYGKLQCVKKTLSSPMENRRSGDFKQRYHA